VTWNGSIPAGGSVTITINATIVSTVPPATTITNQASFSYDADVNGTNETSGVTDDPGTQTAGDGTAFAVAAAAAPIPTLGGWMMLALAGLLAALGMAWMRRG
jgi:hypothetical protein